METKLSRELLSLLNEPESSMKIIKHYLPHRDPGSFPIVIDEIIINHPPSIATILDMGHGFFLADIAWQRNADGTYQARYSFNPMQGCLEIRGYMPSRLERIRNWLYRAARPELWTNADIGLPNDNP